MNKTEKLVVEAETIPLGIQKLPQGIVFDPTWKYLCITYNPHSGARLLIFSSSIIGIESELKQRNIKHYDILPIPNMMRILNKASMRLSIAAQKGLLPCTH